MGICFRYQIVEPFSFRLAREKQRRKDLDDIYNGILKEKNIELWALKQIKLQYVTRDPVILC